MSYDSSEKRLALIQKEILDPNSEIYLENLLDLAASVSYDIHTSGTWKNSKPIKSFLERYSNFSDKAYKYRVTVNDFECLKTIGQGGFGRVDLVRHKQDKNIYAMKVIEKSTYIQNAFNGFWEERDILAKNISDWLVKCFYSFMDLRKLYIVMEYMPGGNLYHWLSTLEELNEEQTLFYAMEMVLAVETLHNMEFLHRDLKPDNMLLDHNGHLKLADFGTCIRVNQGKVKTNFLVGTPDYIAPEVLRKAGVHDLEVGFEIDWWAFGIVVFELFYGETPFEGESTATLYKNIMCYQSTLSYPDDKMASNDFIDFLKNILTEPDQRMTVGVIKKHKYITNNNYSWNLDNIRQHHPPLKVEVSGEADTQYATFDPNDKRNNIASSFTNNNFFSGENLAFTGFTFNRSHQYGFGGSVDVSEMLAKLSETESLKNELSSKLETNLSEFDKIQMELTKLKKELTDKDHLFTMTKNEQNQNIEVRKQLTAKIESLTKQNESLQKDNEQLKVTIGEKDGLIKNSKVETFNYKENVINLKKSLEQAEQKLLETNMDLEEKNCHMENMSKLECFLEEERNMTMELRNDINMKIRKISDYEKQLEFLNIKMVELISSEHKPNNNDADNAASNNNKWLLERETLEAKIKNLKTDLKEIQIDRDICRSENRTLISQTVANEKAKEKLCKEISNVKSQVKFQQNRMYEAEDQLRVLKQKINISESEMNELQSQHDMFKSMAQLKVIELDEVQKEFIELKIHNTESEKELKMQLIKLSKELDEVKDECQLLVEKVTNENKNLLGLVSNHESDIKMKEQELENLLLKNKSNEIEIETLNRTVLEEKNKVASVVLTFEKFVRDPTVTDKYISRKKKEPVNKDALKQIKKLEKELSLAKENMDQKIQELSEVKNECQSWRDKVNDLEQHLEKKENDIKFLVTKLGGTTGSGLGIDEGVAKMTAMTTCFEDKVEILKKGKGRHKITWIPCIGRLKPFRIEIFQNGTENPPLHSIDLRNVMHAKDTTQADCVHIDKNLLTQMIQIIYEKSDTDENRRVDFNRRGNRMSLMSVDEHNISVKSVSPDNSGDGIVSIANHNFIHMKFRTSQICDLCNESCSDLRNPPLCYECIRCKKHFHTNHPISQIPPCSEGIEVISIKLQSNETKTIWMERLLLLKKYQKLEVPRIDPNAHYRSIRHSPNRLSPNDPSIS